MPLTEENYEIINQAEIANLDYFKRYWYYRLSIYERDLEEKSDFIKNLLLDAKKDLVRQIS